MFRVAGVSCLILACLIGRATAQPAAGAAVVPPGYVRATSGVLNHAKVLAVGIVTDRKTGPVTEFLIQPADQGAQAEWFYIRNNDASKAMERGEMSGLLMGVAEASLWGEVSQHVNIRYETVDGEKTITAASIGAVLDDTSTGPQ